MFAAPWIASPRTTKKLKAEIVKTAAKGFVKDVVSITPPASKGSTGAAARKAGEGSHLRASFSAAKPKASFLSQRR
jgi:hypothetical protein